MTLVMLVKKPRILILPYEFGFKNRCYRREY